MKTINYAFLAFSIIMMLLVAQPVLGVAYNSNLEINAQSAASCPIEDTMITVTLKNLGTDADRYTIKSNNDWVTIGNDIITLNGGDSKTFAMWVKPDITADAGEYQITLTATPDSDKNQNYEDTIDFVVMKCHGVELTTTTETINSCIGETETVDVTFKNTGKTEETFIIYSTIGTFDTKTITITSGLEKTEKLSIPVAKNKETVTVTAEATTSYAKETAEINVAANGACYGIAVLNIPPHVTVCKGDAAKIVVTTKNTGFKTGTFELTTDADNAYFKNEELELEPKEVSDTYLEVQTETLDIGDFDYSITINSENTEDVAYGTITVEQCYNAEIVSENTDATICPGTSTGFETELVNTGKKEDTYTISTDIGSVSETEMTIAAGESEKVLIVLETEKTDTETKNINLQITSTNIDVTKELTVSMKEFDTCYGLSVSSDKDSVFAEDLKGYLYTLTITNDGEFEAEYTATLKGPKWATINPDTMKLLPKESAETYVYVSPEYTTAEGTYNLKVTIESDKESLIEKELEFVFKSEKVVAPITGQITTTDTKDQSTTTNIEDNATEDKKWPLNIITAIIVGIIIILLIIFGPELLKDDESEDSDKKDKKKEDSKKETNKSTDEKKTVTKKAEVKKEDTKKAEKVPAKKKEETEKTLDTKKKADTKKKTEAKKVTPKKKTDIRDDRKDDIKQILDSI